VEGYRAFYSVVWVQDKIFIARAMSSVGTTKYWRSTNSSLSTDDYETTDSLQKTSGKTEIFNESDDRAEQDSQTMMSDYKKNIVITKWFHENIDTFAKRFGDRAKFMELLQTTKEYELKAIQKHQSGNDIVREVLSPMDDISKTWSDLKSPFIPTSFYNLRLNDSDDNGDDSDAIQQSTVYRDSAIDVDGNQAVISRFSPHRSVHIDKTREEEVELELFKSFQSQVMSSTVNSQSYRKLHSRNYANRPAYSNASEHTSLRNPNDYQIGSPLEELGLQRQDEAQDDSGKGSYVRSVSRTVSWSQEVLSSFDESNQLLNRRSSSLDTTDGSSFTFPSFSIDANDNSSMSIDGSLNIYPHDSSIDSSSQKSESVIFTISQGIARGIV
jgi:hypothetical protein